ncbi:MAG: hypothetical protein P3B98_11665 [Gemmatimonadota bacterium]|nr:hypothetical protein [Gemmatimonadota bacterium]
MNKRLLLLSSVLATAIFAAPASAQTCSIASTSASAVNCTVGTTLSMTMPSLMKLTLSGTAVTLTAPAAISDFDASTGLSSTTTTGPTFSVRSNRSYRVQVHADAATFSHTAPSGAATYNKPIADVEYLIDGGTPVTLTTSATDIGSGSAVSNSTAVQVAYKTAFDITKDQPGAYSLGVTFTLVAP